MISPWEKLSEELNNLRCPLCLGYGVCDDAGLGDISYNTWKCPRCNGSGFEKEEIKVLVNEVNKSNR